MHYYSDPTANIAIGNASKEWRNMVYLALRLRTCNNDKAWEAAIKRRFTGIYSRLLTDPIELLEQQMKRNK